MEPPSDDLHLEDDSFLPQPQTELVNPVDGTPITPLSRIPADIGTHRALLFALDTPVQFDQKAWEKYWPFIDNVWCLHNKGDVTAHLQNTGKTQKFWGGCRLQRIWKIADRGEKKDGRKRVRREPGMCPAKFRVVMDEKGVRTLERSKEGHSHDLEHIDSVKRCSGVRNLVADPFFAGWDSGPILAYLKDVANAPPTIPDVLDLAGGKYLDRREIINIFAIKLRAAYPGLDQYALKRQKEKYEGVKTCNVKGCNRSFKDAKELAAHKKSEHEQRKHNHSDKMYTCPRKECHRYKRSKGFVTIVSLREHMLRMKHWGSATHHADEGLRKVQAVSEEERLATERGEIVDAGVVPESLPSRPEPSQPQQQHQTFHSPDLSFLPSTDGGAQMPDFTDHDILQLNNATGSSQDTQQRDLMLQRLQALEAERVRMEQEMQRLRSALFTG
jgi:hypothetical protein